MDKEEKKHAAFSPKLIGAIADEVSRTLLSRLPGMMRGQKKKKKKKKTKKIEYAIFLDTSAIIDGRIFDIIATGLLSGNLVIIHSVLMELKNLADSQDAVKRERGRSGLERLERLKKERTLKIFILSLEIEDKFQKLPVDERLIRLAKLYNGKIVTCDYNLEKKAQIENIRAININALANYLKVIAVPGESIYMRIIHPGKEPNQGVGYLEDGTMIVVENGADLVGTSVSVVVSRVIQTLTGKILFAKKI